MTSTLVPAPLWRRLLAALYDGLLLIGLWLAAVLFAWAIEQIFTQGPLSPAFTRAYLFLITFGFFAWFWMHGGQTLGMRAWKLQLRTRNGQPLTWTAVMTRFAVAIPAWGLGGLGMLWCAIDVRGRSWHDLASGTEIVQLETLGS